MDDGTERWLPIPGYVGYYDVSSWGRVRSIAHMTSKGMRGGRIRRLHTSSRSGYVDVSLVKDGVQRTFRVHQLVAAAFIGPCPEGQEVRDMDGTRDNNVPSNLAYGDRSANMMDAVGHGTHPQSSKTYCVNEHEFTPDNTYMTDRGGRGCKTCRNDRQQDWLQRNAQSGRTCGEADCDEPQAAKGLCKGHYSKQRYAEKMSSTDHCSEDDCDKPPFALGLCNGHYKKRSRDHAQ